MKALKNIGEILLACLLLTTIIIGCYYSTFWTVVIMVAIVLGISSFLWLKNLKKKLPKPKHQKSPKIVTLGQFKVRQSYLIAAIAALFFILLNPSLRDFKDYTGESNYTLRRTGYFLFFSIYEKESYYRGKSTVYLGVCKNFVFIKHDPQ